MKIAICDDNKIDIEVLGYFLKLYFGERKCAAEIIRYSSGKTITKAFMSGMKFDAVFMDIYMEGMLGIEAAKKLRDNGYDNALIFVSETDDYAVAGYDVHAVGYILKPHSYDKLSRLMDSIVKNRDIGKYKIKRRGEIIAVPYNEIVYIESDNNKCILKRQGGEKYRIYKKLGDIERELADNVFLRCHQSYIVNMSYIVAAKDKFILSDGETVLIKSREAKAIKRKYYEFTGK